jgi:acyl-CoA thioesterase I
MWFSARAGFYACRHRSYGNGRRLVQRFVCMLMLASALSLMPGTGLPQDRPLKIVAFGDSLTAGFRLSASAAFPARLEQALKAKGLNVIVANAGVSGDTASGGLARVAWSVPPDADAAILELGANDMLRGIDPKVTRASLESIIRTLKSRGVEVMLAGMRAAPNLGPDYQRNFDAIYPDLASAYGLVFYPFFLDGIVTDPKLNLNDGLHPNQAGIDVIVARMLPKVEELIARVRARR